MVIDEARHKPDRGITALNVGYNVQPPGVRYPDYRHPGDYVFDGERDRTPDEFQLVFISRGRASSKPTARNPR